MKTRPFFITVLALVLPATLCAQESVRFSGRVVNKDNQPLPFANTVLVSKTDSIKIYGGTADNGGNFSLTAPRGDYHFEISYLGYDKYGCDLSLSRDSVTNDIALQPAAVSVKEVTVQGQNVRYNSNGYTMVVGDKALYKGFNLNDVLGMSPGIIVGNGGLSVYGKGVSKVYLNERELKLSGSALADYLKGINAENIKQIEVIAGSGVEDDATAMGGRVLKITTKTPPNNGGVVTLATVAQYTNGAPSFVLPRLNADIKQGKFSTYLRSNYRNSQTKEQLKQISYFDNSDLTREVHSKQYGKNPLGLYLTWGMGYDFNDKNLLSVEASYSKRDGHTNTTSQTIDRIKGVVSEDIDGDIRNNTNNEGVNVSANYIHLMKNNGKLVFKADWAHSTSSADATQDYFYRVASTDKHSLNNIGFMRNTYTASADYSKALRKNQDKFMAGVKFSHFSSHNEVLYQNLINGIWVDDPDYTDDYYYRETVYAAYAKYALGLKKFNLTFGLRLEQTEMDPESKIYPDRNHTSHYTDLFPEVSVGYNINKKKGHMISLRYQRSLQRPSFMALNPYIRPTGPFSYFIGNPYLKPEYRNSIELNTVLFGKYVLVGSYRRGNGSIREVTFRKDDNVVYTQQQNLGNSDEAMAYLVVPVQLRKWWKLDLQGGYMYQSVRYGTSHLTNNMVMLAGNSTMQLPGKFNLVVSAEWMSRVLVGNIMVEKPVVMTAKLNKTLCKNRLALALSISDLLNAEGRMPLVAYGNGFTQHTQKTGNYISYSFTASYTFKWGKQAKIRQVEAGNKEERARE